MENGRGQNVSEILLDPRLVPAAFTAQECDLIIQTAECEGWNVATDTVDDEPAWEVNLLRHTAGKMAATRMRDIIVSLSVEFTPSRYMIYARKYGPTYRPSLAPHHDRSTVSFTVALSDDFTGGEFFYLDAAKVEQSLLLNKGDAVVFGGNVMHGVRAVQGGIRYSLVMHCM